MIYLIDASVYVFRAYYSMPPEMTDSDGNPAHATFGFARFLGDLIERAQPRYMAVAFDESLSTSFRNRIFPAYKANRDPPPADLKLQFERCQEFCRHAGIPAFSHAEYEADDIVGTLASLVHEARQASVGPEGVVVLRPDASGALVERIGDGEFRLVGRDVERVVALNDVTTPEALSYIDFRLERLGVPKMLAKAGAQEGDVIWIGEFSFDYQPDL